MVSLSSGRAEVGQDHRMLFAWMLPGLVPSGHLHPQASVHMASLAATLSDVALPPLPSHFLILFFSQDFITELFLFICSLFLVSFPILGESLMETENLTVLFVTVFST